MIHRSAFGCRLKLMIPTPSPLPTANRYLHRFSLQKMSKNGIDDDQSFANHSSLAKYDPEIHDLITAERKRQIQGLELIASENFISSPVMEAMGSCLTNKYVEGYPGERYYGGNEFVDQVELLAIKRALEAFGLDQQKWAVNVQSFSGSPANFTVYHAILGKGGRLMGLGLADGGHLTHGFYTQQRKVSASAVYFESLQYRVNPRTGLIDMEQLEVLANAFKPKLIVCGASSYPRDIEYAEFRRIADKNGSLLMCDMAHISGLVAAGVVRNPFEFCDIVTTTTHKTMRGPRSALIFSKKDVQCPLNPKISISEAIDRALFPGLQGGAHMHTIAAVAVALKELKSEEFKDYAHQILANSRQLVQSLQNYGYEFLTNGTDNHLSLLCLDQTKGLDGAKVSYLFEKCGISVNKNAIPKDKSVLRPSGIRLGTAALTSRKMKEADIEEVARFVHEAMQLAIKTQAKLAESENATSIELFKNCCHEAMKDDIDALKQRISQFASRYYMPGY